MSRSRGTIFLNLQGRAREAMERYREIFGGVLEVEPASRKERVAHARLEATGIVLLASDGHPDYPARVGDNVAVVVEGNDREWLSGVFRALADGGGIQMPLTEMSGVETGWLTDRFGIHWTVRIEAA